MYTLYQHGKPQYTPQVSPGTSPNHHFAPLHYLKSTLRNLKIRYKCFTKDRESKCTSLWNFTHQQLNNDGEFMSLDIIMKILLVGIQQMMNWWVLS